MSIDRPVRHALAWAVLSACLSLGVAPAQAARLGALTVLSERTQPFEAEVELEDVGANDSAVPQIVAPGTYSDLGLTFPPALRGATVTVDRRASDGRPVARIRAARPADGSELIVVMSLTTPTGRHLRSYRLDLDASPARGAAPPPAPTPTVRVDAPPPPPQPAAPAPAAPVAALPAAPSSPSAVEPPRMEPPRSEVRVEALPAPASPPPVALPTARAPEPRPAARAPAAEAATSAPTGRAAPAGGGAAPRSTVTIARGDTAASLAARVKPADVTEAQAALALFRNNPKAFSGSVHRPRPGETLVVPDPEQMRALPASIAESAYRARGSGSGSGSGPAAPVATRERGDRLKLTAGGTGRGRALDGPGGASRDVAFNAAMAEARSRITQLESIVAGLEKLIAERERQIGEMTESLRVAGRPIAPPGPAAAGAISVAGAPTMASGPPPMSAATAGPPAGMAPPPPEPVAAAPAPAPAASATMLAEPSRRAPPVPMPAPEPDPIWMDPMVLGAGGGVVLLLGVLAFMRRRAAGPRPRARSRRPAAA